MPGCSPERELGVRQQRRGGVWWIWLGCVCSLSAGTREFEQSPRTMRCTHVTPLFCADLGAFSFAPAKLARQPLTSPRDGS